MTEASYSGAVAALLSRGDPRGLREWPDYLASGLTAADVPDLIRMVTDEDLNFGDPDSAAVWAPLHAWRALAQLRAAEAVEPLLSMLNSWDDNDSDWYLEEMPTVLGMIGPPGLRKLASYLADEDNSEYPRVAVAHALAETARRHPEARGECVGILARQLALFERQEEDINGFLISYLVDLGATEHSALIEQVFAAERVDAMIRGSWGDVRRELGVPGLGLAPDEPERPVGPWFEAPLSEPAGGLSKKERRAKRKRERQARRKNRKKKK